MNEPSTIPPLLYHASATPGITILQPSSHPGVGGQAVVFAASDPLFALAMSYGTGNQLAVGYYHDPVTNQTRMFVDELEPSALGLLQASAVVYEVAGVGFATDLRLSNVEYISNQPVPVVGSHHIDNVFTYLQQQPLVDLVPYDGILAAMRQRGRQPQAPEQPHGEDRFGSTKIF